MNEQLFRRKSIDRVNFPEQLNEYIHVANPGVWLVLAAVVALLSVFSVITSVNAKSAQRMKSLSARI